MTDIQIPREALEAAARAMCCTGGECQMTKRTCKSYLLELDARKAISAGLKAWQNGDLHVPVPAGAPRKSFTLPAMILPVSLENTDAEA